MKDIEKIKSEDLACQVADANPANFAIEQEVAAMVGATVPQPTQPSADDARELGAQLLVFLRRALTPIQTALRTALADIYDHLDSRCTDYTPAAYAPYQDPSTVPPYDPMRPLTPRTLPNLLTAITAFSARKISNGSATADGIPDGMSLARLLCDVTCAANVTKIIDDSKGWTLTKNNIMATIRSLFPNIAKIKLGCKESVGVVFGAAPDDTDLSELEHIQYNGSGAEYATTWISKNGDLHLPKLKDFYANQRGAIIYGDVLNGSFIAEEIETISGGWDGQFINTYRMPMFYAPKLRILTGGGWHESRNLGASSVGSTDLLTEVIVGYGSVFSHANYLSNRPNVIKVEFRVTADTNVNLAGWNPTNVLADADKTATFLQNFLEHICKKLANRTGQTKLTLTLSADVYTAIMTDNDIKAELVARNWKVTDGSNNYNN